MQTRRDFLKAVGATTAGALIRPRQAVAEGAGDSGATIRFSSDHMELALSPTAPEFVSLNVDGLGKGRRGVNVVGASSSPGGYRATVSDSHGARRVEYRAAGARSDAPAAWKFELGGSRMVLTSNWASGQSAPQPIVFHFDLKQVHSTVLGVFRRDKLLAAPVLMHFPGQGSLRLTSSVPDAGLTYASHRAKGYLSHFDEAAALSLPAASAANPRIVYTLEAAAIYPQVSGIEGDARFDAFRRNWLNVLQLNPSFPALANNTASDTCALCYYEYGDIAALTPPLAEGLTACDVLRQTLDRILCGKLAYAMPGYGMPGLGPYPCVSADTHPSLIIAAANCVRGGGGDAWLEENYSGIRDWAEAMLSTDGEGDGLIEYCRSGDSGSWKLAPDGGPRSMPSSWFDLLGFGHEDAYANALAYRALLNMAAMAKRIGRADDAAR